MLIEQVAETIFLCVNITEILTWDNNINTVCNKVSKGIRIICKNRHSILMNLYITLVHPYFQYCNIGLVSNPSLPLSKLAKMQKRAMHVITNSKWIVHTASLLKIFLFTLYAALINFSNWMFHV